MSLLVPSETRMRDLKFTNTLKTLEAGKLNKVERKK